MPLRRFAVIGAALIAEDGVRDVTTARRNDAAATSAASPGHSITGGGRGSSALIYVCYHWATSPVVTCALLQRTD